MWDVFNKMQIIYLLMTSPLNYTNIEIVPETKYTSVNELYDNNNQNVLVSCAFLGDL